MLVFISTIFARIPFAMVTLFISPVFLVLVYGVYLRRTRPYAAGIMLSAIIVWSVSSLWTGVDIRAAPDAVLVTMPHAERIFIAPKKNVSIQHTILRDHNSGDPEYLIARDRTFTSTARFYEYPDELITMRVQAGDVTIACDKTISVAYQDTVVFTDDGGCDGQTEVLYILSDGKRTERFKTPLHGTILDHIIRDLRVTFTKIRLLLG